MLAILFNQVAAPAVVPSTFSQGKSGVGDVFPENVVEKSWGDLEPLITPEQLVNRHLFGIPLVSRFKDPLTGKAQRFTQEMLQDEIFRAIKRAEVDTHLDINPVTRHEKHPFDRMEYEAFGYFRLGHRPATNILALKVVPANNLDIYVVPLAWVETALLARGQINVVPLNIAIQNGGFIPSQSAGGAVFLSILAQKSWIPSYWQVDYASGFPDNLFPIIINELIGIIAAKQILEMLAATWWNTSHSIGLDAMSQSISTPGPAIFGPRIAALEEDRKRIVKQMKTMLGLNFFSGNV
jgi:hypothetical protein